MKELRDTLKDESYFQRAIEQTESSINKFETLISTVIETKDAAWHNSHKSKQDVYYGYWSYEAGAIVKCMGLDGSLLKDEKYYSYDLVH